MTSRSLNGIDHHIDDEPFSIIPSSPAIADAKRNTATRATPTDDADNESITESITSNNSDQLQQQQQHEHVEWLLNQLASIEASAGDAALSAAVAAGTTPSSANDANTTNTTTSSSSSPQQHQWSGSVRALVNEHTSLRDDHDRLITEVLTLQSTIAQQHILIRQTEQQLETLNERYTIDTQRLQDDLDAARGSCRALTNEVAAHVTTNNQLRNDLDAARASSSS
jgi:predicted RNase H-like nuclease (RuvC/YqgF family)